MKTNKEIEEIFKEKFDSFEPNVPDSVWGNIQNGMGNAAAGSSGAASGGLLSSTLGKIAAVVIGGGLIAGSVYLYNNYQVTPRNTEDLPKSSTLAEATETSSSTLDPEIATPHIESKVVSVETSENWDEISEPKAVRIKTITKKDQDPKAPVYESVADMELTKSSRTILTLEELDALSADKPKTENPATENLTVVAEVPEDDGKPFATIITSVVGGNAPLEVDFENYSTEGKIKWVFGDGDISRKDSPKHTYEEAGNYVVSLIIELPDGNVVMDEKVIEVTEAITSDTEEEVAPSQITSTPNVFTPNGDGINDFMVVGAENMEAFHFVLMDINSQQILFESQDPAFKWDGTLSDGKMIEKGTYIYVIRAKGKDGDLYDKSGALSVQ